MANEVGLLLRYTDESAALKEIATLEGSCSMAVRKTEDPLDRYIMSDEEWRERFDNSCRNLLGISGDEFTARWDAGEYGDPDEHPQRNELWILSMMIPRAYKES